MSLYLVPNLLGVVPPENVLPARTIEIARNLRRWIVETPKPARAFIKSLAPARAIADLDIRPLDEADPGALFADATDIGLLSDAGAPGVADPGATIVAAAHAAGIRVVPLVGPSSILLALMAAGMNGQRFAFHGYLPVAAPDRTQALRTLEDDSRANDRTQVFIETPYRNVAMIEAIASSLRGTTEVCVAADLTLPTETIERRTAASWRREDASRFAKRPAIFVLSAR
jgi:16S rRNA (cytidine1402-2'-O)-methyltransferase